MMTTMSTRGRVVIPKAIRDTLRLTPKMELGVRVHEGSIFLEPICTSAIEAPDGTSHGTDSLPGLEGEPRRRSIVELEGLGQEVWAGIDAQEHVDGERASWGGQRRCEAD